MWNLEFVLYFSIFFLLNLCMSFTNSPVSKVLLLLIIVFWSSVFLFATGLGFWGFILLMVYCGAVVVVFMILLLTMERQIKNEKERIIAIILFYVGIGLCVLVGLGVEYIFFKFQNEVIVIFGVTEERLKGGPVTLGNQIEFSIKHLIILLFGKYTGLVIIGGFILYFGILGVIGLTGDTRLKYYKSEGFTWNYLARWGNIVSFSKKKKKNK